MTHLKSRALALHATDSGSEHDKASFIAGFQMGYNAAIEDAANVCHEQKVYYMQPPEQVRHAVACSGCEIRIKALGKLAAHGVQPVLGKLR